MMVNARKCASLGEGPAAACAAALGKARREGHNWRCICPLHGGQSLTVADGRNGRLLVRCWAGCEARDILAELRRMGLNAGRCDGARAAPMPVRAAGRDDTARRSALARRLWDTAQDARGSPVTDYLARRGIIIPPPPSLRWEPRCWHREARGELPAMVARIDNIDGEPIGIHRTYLARDDRGQWRRRDRASLGPIGGAAVRLAPAGDTLMIGEGIETRLAAMQATAQPAWAALSTSGMVALILPPTVRSVVILADHDRNGAGGRAAFAAGQRWLAEGRRVRIAMPPEPGTDIADVLAGRAYTGIAEVRDAAA